MSHRFRFLAQHCDLNVWELSKEEFQHLEKVLRIAPGTPIELADGAGFVGFAKWENYEKIAGGAVRIQAEREQFFPKSESTLSVCMPALAHKDMDDVIEDLSEVGVDRLCVFSGEGSDKNRINEKTVERWKRIARAAMKQCKRPWLLEIETFSSVNLALMTLQNSEIRIWASELGEVNIFSLTANTKKRNVTLIVGGEKGLSEIEQNTIKSENFTPVKFGSNILRARTCVVLASGVAKIWMDCL